MKFSIENMPLLPGQNNGRSVETVDANALKSIGVSGSAFAMHVGDKISFEATDEPLVISQKVRANDPQSPLAYYVACERNDKPSWIGISVFTRRDADGQPVGEFQKTALREPSFAAVYANLLAGKTITADTTSTYKASEFDTAGNRLNTTVERTIPVIKYA